MKNTRAKLSHRRVKFLDNYFQYKSLKHLYSLQNSYCKAIVVLIIRGRDTELIEGALAINRAEVEIKKEILNIYGNP